MDFLRLLYALGEIIGVIRAEDRIRPPIGLAGDGFDGLVDGLAGHLLELETGETGAWPRTELDALVEPIDVPARGDLDCGRPLGDYVKRAMIMTSMENETALGLGELGSLVGIEHVLPLVEEDMAVIEIGEEIDQVKGGLELIRVEIMEVLLAGNPVEYPAKEQDILEDHEPGVPVVEIGDVDMPVGIDHLSLTEEVEDIRGGRVGLSVAYEAVIHVDGSLGGREYVYELGGGHFRAELGG